MKVVIRIIGFIISVAVIFNGRFVLAYDGAFAHRQLSDRTIYLWQQARKAQVTDEEKKWLVDGSEQEDNPVYRSINHFYDPLTGRGLNLFGNQLGFSAPEWASKQGRQNELWGGDFGWTVGIKALQAAEMNLAWTTLGHNLHLLADMGSPAHVHNDDHVEGDDYEIYVKALLSTDKEFINRLANLKEKEKCDSLDNCLKSMSLFTSRRALSKDWSSLKNLPPQTMLSTNGKFYLDNKLIAKYDPLSEMAILDNEVYDAYWQDLGPLVISYGQSLIDHYWREAGKEIPLTNLKPKPEKKVKPKINLPFLPPLTPKPVVPKINPPKNNPTPIVDDIIDMTDPEKWYWPVVDESIGIPEEYLISIWSPPIATPMPTTIIKPKIDPPVSKPNLPVEPSEQPDTKPVDEANVPETSSQPGSSGSAGAAPPAKSITPIITFVGLPDSYSNDLMINWRAEPSGDWLFDLNISYDGRPWQAQLANNTAKQFYFSADEVHHNLEVHVTGRLADGTSTSTMAKIEFKPIWPNNLLAYWSFDDCPKTNAEELIGNNDLPIAMPAITGKIGCGFSQDGSGRQSTGRFLKIPLNESQMTLSYFWRDATNWPEGYGFNKLVLVDADQKYQIGITPSIDLIYYWHKNKEYKLNMAMPKNHDWHHVAAVFTRDYFKFYLDGQLSREIAGDYSFSAPIIKFYLNGEISVSEFDDIAWWSGELSSEQIKKMSNGQRLWQ